MCHIKLNIVLGKGETAIGVGRFKDTKSPFISFKPLQNQYKIGDTIDNKEDKQLFNTEFVSIEVQNKEAFNILKSQVLELEKYFND